MPVEDTSKSGGIGSHEISRKNALLDAINSHPLAGNDYFSCMQCGRCVGSCPAAKVSPRFNMRVINRRIMDGDETLLEDEIIWDCFYCQTCVNLCPRENLDGYRTILILRDLALNRGLGKHHMKRVIPIMEQFMEKGVLTDGDSWMDAESLEQVKRIARETGLPEHVNSRLPGEGKNKGGDGN